MGNRCEDFSLPEDEGQYMRQAPLAGRQCLQRKVTDIGQGGGVVGIRVGVAVGLMATMMMMRMP